MTQKLIDDKQVKPMVSFGTNSKTYEYSREKLKDNKMVNGVKTENLFPKSQSPGSLHLEFKRCGKPRCKCVQGLLHGPYIYRRWRESGRLRRQYVPMTKLGVALVEIHQNRAQWINISHVLSCLKE